MKQKINFKTLGLILVGILVLTAIGYGGYKLLNKEKDANNNTNESTNSAETDTDYNSTVTDLGDGWMKYENKEYGFSFEYPNFWTKENLDSKFAQINLSTSKVFYLTKNDEKKCLVDSNQCQNYVFFYLFNKSLYSDKPLMEWYKNLGVESSTRGGSEIVEFEKIYISNTEAWKLKLMPIAGDVNPNDRFYSIEIANSTKNYVFQLQVDDSNINSEVIEKIISTFKFD